MTIEKIISLIGILVIGIPSLNAQQIKPQDGIIIHENAPRTCLVVNLDPEPKTLKKAWKDYLKKDLDIKLEGIGFLVNKDLLYAEGAFVKRIAADPLNFYTYIIEDENGSEMKVFVELKSEIYADRNNHPYELGALEEILQDFLAAYLPTYYYGRVNDAEKRLVELAKEQEDLKKKIAKDTKKIEELQGQIEQRRLELGSNQAKLELAELKLQARQEKMKRIQNQLNK